MTSEKPPAVENEALEKKIGAIEAEVANVKVAIKRAGRTRLFLLVVALVIIGVAIGMFYSLARELSSKEYLAKLGNKATEKGKDLSQQALSQLKDLRTKCEPILKEAFSEQVNKDRDAYQAALNRETTLLKENLENSLREKMHKYFEEEASPRYQAILREEFPELQDPEMLEKLSASMTDAFQNLIDEYYTENLQREVEDINHKYFAFEKAEVPAEGDAKLNKEFVASLMYLAALKIDPDSVE